LLQLTSSPRLKSGDSSIISKNIDLSTKKEEGASEEVLRNVDGLRGLLAGTSR
jgi:hypothetical protein